LHPTSIDLGLARVAAVRDRLGLAPKFPIVTVGGTNGKGSTCAMLEACLQSAGYRTGKYTSPHLLRYNERVRIRGDEVADALLIEAFERIEHARGDISLTYFEFGTLAAVLLFIEAKIDVAVLEVGLGGRLDAVNAFEPDCSVLTSVGLDHMEFLGHTRELIGLEKAGIFRPGKPAVVAEPSPPAAVLERAGAIGADLYLVDRDFGYAGSDAQWRFWDWLGKRSNLPLPALRGEYQLQNAAAALAALDSLRDRLAVDMGAIRRGLVELELPGRFQVLPGMPTIVLDVAHNPHAAVRFAQTLHKLERKGRRLAVFAMLKDKDIEGVLDVTKSAFDAWYVAPLTLPRGADAARLQQALAAVGVTAPVRHYDDIAGALRAARGSARSDDKIVVFGSFYTVAEALRTLPGVSGNR